MFYGDKCRLYVFCSPDSLPTFQIVKSIEMTTDQERSTDMHNHIHRTTGLIIFETQRSGLLEVVREKFVSVFFNTWTILRCCYLTLILLGKL